MSAERAISKKGILTKGKQMKTASMMVVILAWAAGPLYGDASEQPPPVPAEEQPEVLTRGPVHEAFAEPVDLQFQAGLVAPTLPPANIVENPPADRPAGAQFVWIPGYWSWDSERNSYIWISGCWRAAPPNMYWVPGYWAKVPEGWEWIAGFWTPVSDIRQIEYLPPPPALDEVQPPGQPPSPENIWVPPSWYWHQGQYILRPGYWLMAQAEWVWMPSHYVLTPRGYVFVGGYWDYQLNHRGVLFAPVYFPRPVYERVGFSYSAYIVIDIDNLQFSLFTYPRYHHYYFGDYYDTIYIGVGIYPWFECERRHTWYDPIYQHNRWHFRRTDPRWEEHERNEYDRRRANKELRPPRTYHEMETRLAGMPQSQRRNMQMAEPLRTFVTGKAAPLKFERIKNDAREKLSRHSTDVYTFREERSQWESSAGGRKTIPPSMERKDSVTQPDRVKIPDSPVVGKRSFWSAFKKGPPSRPADERKTEVKNNRRAK